MPHSKAARAAMRFTLPLLLSLLVPFAAGAQPLSAPLAAALSGASGASGACPAARAATLYLPHVKATLARNHEVLVVAIGSSSTVSWMSSNIAHSYPAILQDELNSRLPTSQVAVINRGIGGQGAAQELPRLATDVLPIRPQLVIWQVGANDALKDVDPAAFRRQMLTGIAALQEAGADVILMDNQRSPRILAVAENEKIDRTLEEVAAEAGVAFFDRAGLMDSWKAEGFPYADFIASDNLHQNDRGYRCVATALATAITDGLTAHPAREAMQTRVAGGG